MDTFIGFLELLAWAACVIVLAAAVTFAVIKLFPSREEREPRETAEPEGSGS